MKPVPYKGSFKGKKLVWGVIPDDSQPTRTKPDKPSPAAPLDQRVAEAREALYKTEEKEALNRKAAEVMAMLRGRSGGA